MIDKVLFPRPSSSYKKSMPGISHFPKTKLVYLSVPYPGSQKVLLYFHGNQQDLGHCQFLLSQVSSYLEMSVVAVEYPGYGIAKGKPNEKRLLRDALAAFDACVEQLGWNPEKIVVAGRSLGSGPACYIASKRDPGAVLLVSPLCSVKAVATSKFCIAGFFINERFPNRRMLKEAKCPTLIVHGKRDKQISWEHSVRLYRVCAPKSKLVLVKDMGHESCLPLSQIYEPLKGFLEARLS